MYPLIFIIKFDIKTNLTCFEMFSLLQLNRCIQRRIQDPVKYLKWSFSQKYLAAKNMLTNFANGCIIDVWPGSECASECNSIKSYWKLAILSLKSYPKKWKFSLRKILQVLRNQNKDMAIFFGPLSRHSF